ncbi:MAG: S1 RNA-binding domain-containing protein [Ardenticatenaceae bacterium]|nr:S1 RNA-binding domain-containing protein [Ardenticatenaceae bacterium]HBY98285.1 30S ribosomal protein S1 [Chloroflexota bacterium]
MFDPNRWSIEDEGYWQTIVKEGRWAETAPPPGPGEYRDFHSRPSRVYDTGAVSDADWSTLEDYFNRGEVLVLPVVGYNKGGLLVEWEGLQGFVPASQLSDCTKRLDESLGERMAYLAEQIDQQIRVKIIELDRSQNRIIFSERAAAWQGRCPDEIIDELEPGDVCVGQVSNLCDFGVFVDLGGIDGLIHVSELSWRRVNHPRDVLAPGQEVQVYVIDVDRERRRIALSLKRLQANPWATVAERYRVGQIIEAVITNVVDFGAFARIEDGVEGLIHISELGAGDIPLHPRSVLTEGQCVHARILNVDPDNQRMGLTMREVPQPGNQAAPAFAVQGVLAETTPSLEASAGDGSTSFD